MRAAPIGWGVIGATSQVAQKAVLPAIVASPWARLVAVASTHAADVGGAGFGAVRAYRAYAALLDDPEVEAVYVPLPNSLHREWVERAAAAGKHVLCEKPLAPTPADAEAMAAACAAAGVTLLEAYMTPFHPRAMAIETLVASGRLGGLRFARAAFTGVLDRPDDHRWRPEMGRRAGRPRGSRRRRRWRSQASTPRSRAGSTSVTGSPRPSSAPSTLRSGSPSRSSEPRPRCLSIARTLPGPRTRRSRSATVTVVSRRSWRARRIRTGR